MQNMKYILILVAGLAIQGNNAESASKIGSQWVEIDGKQYYFEMQNYADWHDAQALCERRNLTLISYQTVEKWNSIRNFLLLEPDFDMNLWSSGAKLADGQFLWRSTGEEVTYTDWATGEPNLPAGSEFCVVVSAFPNGWDDIECTDRWFASVCEEP
ncbi:Hypothetical predicted protein [Cloeon dipterum]|uniref:C-type lectin domain-containing protein n=1 Tax=Cloeon dipterum TaxID=197152 RepID=A0A8S1D4N5_9INSE|nr:Hypothetical predicted protein [Cloeon dipterum]